ncbi:ribosome biogenesis GTP-binding protein YihA/YsxC [Acetobacteroides hydrogenigenes]|uniref:Probable GTP-binding protein EngB n=1 Tax=Acetobacteroides hydrogenigenes TaxID=979970 RepID=A0A4R2EUH6_9BACT|nr:ribosome biogenesis GTP-binding protein YihA/YsxC [Acetobacteroides hydrogenigenes]TCN72959.1 GTP-binding protein [Acetobacteroides hydrogenigenes]
MQVKSAVFVKSAEKASQCPPQTLPEFAFIGRSNVGKSSLINYITNQKGLAKVSGTPGKTKLINYFLVNDGWYLVDLPGYGYAKASKGVRQGFAEIITKYLESRDELTCLFVLVDSRLEPQKIDVDFITLLGNHGIPFAIVFTKIDKIGVEVLRDNIRCYSEKLLESWEELPPMLYTSSSKRKGADELLTYIDDCIELVNTNK